ncbi:MAG: hypothetical protein ACK5N8_02680 [Alphaproteobacteria bacterium]
MKKIFLTLVLLLGFQVDVFAAVGCDLNDPDRDVKRLFPTSTGYKTDYKSLDRMGGEATLLDVENQLGDKFTGIYETIDVPYTVYTVFKGKEVIGYIHGINQKGKYGGLQVFLALNPQGKIEDFYYQKLTSREAEQMRSKEFANQFKNMTFSDFQNYDPNTKANIPNSVSKIEDVDFYSTLRAIKKNLILMNIFVFNQKEK